MNIEIFTLADFASDSGGKLTIVGTFDTIRTPIVPAHHSTCHIAARLRFRQGEFGTHSFRILIVKPDGGALVPPINGSFKIQQVPGVESGTQNLCVGIGGLPLQEYGKHSLVFEIDGRELQNLPFYVSKPIEQH